MGKNKNREKGRISERELDQVAGGLQPAQESNLVPPAFPVKAPPPPPVVAKIPHFPNEILDFAIENKDDNRASQAIRDSKRFFLARSPRELTALLMKSHDSSLHKTILEIEALLKEKSSSH